MKPFVSWPTAPDLERYRALAPRQLRKARDTSRCPTECSCRGTRPSMVGNGDGRPLIPGVYQWHGDKCLEITIVSHRQSEMKACRYLRPLSTLAAGQCRHFDEAQRLTNAYNDCLVLAISPINEIAVEAVGVMPRVPCRAKFRPCLLGDESGDILYRRAENRHFTKADYSAASLTTRASTIASRRA